MTVSELKPWRLILPFVALASLLVLSLLVAYAPALTSLDQVLQQHPDFQEALTYFSLEVLRTGKELARLRLQHYFHLQIVTLSALLVFFASRWTLVLEGFIRQRSRRFWLPLVAIALLAALSLIRLPQEIYGRYFLEKAYGLRIESLGTFIGNLAQEKAINVVGLGLILSGGWFALQRWGRKALVPLAFAAWLIAILLVMLAPIIVDPCFREIRPLSWEELGPESRALLAETGFPKNRLFVQVESRHTKKFNAYVTGLGPTARLVLYDTVLHDQADTGFLSLLGHELGHWQHNHLAVGLGLMLPALLFLAGLTQILFKHLQKKDIAMPISPAKSFALLLIIWNLAFLPLNILPNAISRHFETEADRFSLALTKNPPAFVNNRRQSALQNRSDILPHPAVRLFFATHPTTLERIRLAKP